MTGSRRAIVVSGAAVVAFYLAGAAISGRLSPLARAPLLDGLAPQPYRWVDPPPALAADNQEPLAGTIRVELTPSGSRTAVLATDDNAQITLILEKGAFAAARGQEAVEVTATPIAATEVAPADRPLTIVGNVVRLEATYQPSGDPAEIEPGTARIVLVYPVLAAAHGAHTIVSSADGLTWTPQDTNDLPSIRQADAVLPALGYAAVGEEPGASPTSAGDGGVNTAATVAIVAAIALLLAALFLTLRRRRPSASPARAPTPAAGPAPSGGGSKRKRKRKKRKRKPR